MTPLYHARKSDGHWFVRAFAFLIIGLLLPAVAQPTRCTCTSEC